MPLRAAEGVEGRGKLKKSQKGNQGSLKRNPKFPKGDCMGQEPSPKGSRCRDGSRGPKRHRKSRKKVLSEFSKKVQSTTGVTKPRTKIGNMGDPFPRGKLEEMSPPCNDKLHQHNSKISGQVR